MAPARSIDQRIKSAAWIEAFVAAGGDFRIEKVTPRMLEELSRDYELVIVSTGKGEIGQIFPRDKVQVTLRSAPASPRAELRLAGNPGGEQPGPRTGRAAR